MVNLYNMNDEKNTEKKSTLRGPLYWFDGLIKRFIPNFNMRAILYLSLIFAVVVYIQIWRISSPAKKVTDGKNETVIADQAYWDSQEYKDRIKNRTVDSFTQEFERWLNKQDQEFSRRRFEDMLFINAWLTELTGGDLTVVVPENFNYLENNARARYQYARDKGFLSDKPTLVKLGTLVCDIDEKAEQVTGIELYDWRYASMPKLAAFMKTKPDWKMQFGDKIFDISDPRIEDKDILKLRNAQTQPAGLFSFLVFRYPDGNRIALADSTILENNGVDAKLTLSRITTHWDKQPKLYFAYGYDGCRQIKNLPQIQYGQSD
jgi:hypothetical protein